MVHGSAPEVRPLAKASLFASVQLADSREGREESASAGRCRSLSGGFLSMRNLLDESSVAQSLDGTRLDGSLLFPVSADLGMDLTWRKCRHWTSWLPDRDFRNSSVAGR